MTATLAAPHPPKSRAKRSGVARRRFTYDEYFAMARAGVIGPDERTQLINGQIVYLSPAGSPHASTVRKITAAFYRQLGEERFEILVHDPLHASEHDAPEPDVALLIPGDYDERHPRSDKTLLAVEVSDSTLRYNRTLKAKMYARNAVQEPWIMALPERALYVYRTPTADGYAAVRKLGDGDYVPPLCNPDARLSITAVLPKA